MKTKRPGFDYQTVFLTKVTSSSFEQWNVSTSVGFFSLQSKISLFTFLTGDLHLQDLVVSQLNYLLAANLLVILAVGVSLRTADFGDSGQ